MLFRARSPVRGHRHWFPRTPFPAYDATGSLVTRLVQLNADSGKPKKPSIPEANFVRLKPWLVLNSDGETLYANWHGFCYFSLTHFNLLSTSGNRDRKSTRLNSSHGYISYAVFCLKK